MKPVTVLKSLCAASAVLACAASQAGEVAVVIEAARGHCVARADPRAKAHEIHSGEKLDATDEVRCDSGYSGTVQYLISDAPFKISNVWLPVGNATPPTMNPQAASDPAPMGRQASIDDGRYSAAMGPVLGKLVEGKGFLAGGVMGGGVGMHNPDGVAPNGASGGASATSPHDR